MDNWSQYQNAPHEQVNWAALAQQWMAMKNAEEAWNQPPPPPPPSHRLSDMADVNWTQPDPPPPPAPPAPPPPLFKAASKVERDVDTRNNFQQQQPLPPLLHPGHPKPSFPPPPPDGRHHPSQSLHGNLDPYARGHHDENWRGAPSRYSHNGPSNMPPFTSIGTPYRPPVPMKSSYPDYPDYPDFPPGRFMKCHSSTNPMQVPIPMPLPLHLPPFMPGSAPPKAPPPGFINGPPPRHMLPQSEKPVYVSHQSSKSRNGSTGSAQSDYGPSSGSFFKSNYRDSRRKYESDRSPSPPSSSITLDANARKKLPAWLLEGLEKSEREKQKQLEKEEREKKMEEEKAKRKASEGKSKFESSSEDEDGNDSSDGREVPRKRSWEDDDDEENGYKNQSVLDTRSAEEKREDAIITVKHIMTSLLMDATDGLLMKTIEQCLADASRKEAKAEPKLLANSSALAALSNLGYDDDDDDSSDAESKEGNSRSSSDHKELFKVPMGIPRNFSKTESSYSKEGSPSSTRNREEYPRSDSRSPKGGGKYKHDKLSDDEKSRKRRKSRSRSRDRKRSRSPREHKKSRDRKRSRSRERRKRSRSSERSYRKRSRSRDKR